MSWSSANAYKKVLDQLMGLPWFASGYQLLSVLGDDMGEFMLSGKEGKQAMKDDPTGYMKLKGKKGKAFYFDTKKFLGALPEAAKRMQEKQIASFEESYQLLSKTPQYSQLFKDAKGEFSPEFTAAVDQAFGQLGSYGLSGGVKSGFLHDPVKQGAILGPVAMQKTQYLKALEDAAYGKTLQLSGGAGAAATAPAGWWTPATPGQYINPMMQLLGMDQQMSMFDDQMSFQKSQAKMDFFGDIAGSAAAMYGAKMAGGSEE